MNKYKKEYVLDLNSTIQKVIADMYTKYALPTFKNGKEICEKKIILRYGEK